MPDFMFHAAVLAGLVFVFLVVGGIGAWVLARGIEAIDALNVGGL